MERSNAVERVSNILEEMNSLLQNSRKAFMSSNSYLVDRDQLMDMMEDLRSSLPGEIEQAKKVIKERFNGKYPVRKSIQTEFAHVGGPDGLLFQIDGIAYAGEQR